MKQHLARMLLGEVPSSVLSLFPCPAGLRNVPGPCRAWGHRNIPGTIEEDITVQRQTPNLTHNCGKTVLISVLSHTGSYNQAVKNCICGSLSEPK